MNGIANITSILSDLLDKSRSGQVIWEKGANLVSNGFPVGNEFIANFSDFAISVAKALPIEGVESVSFSIYGIQEQLLHTARVFKNEKDFEILDDLHASAQEQVVGLSALFEKFRTAVNSLGTKSEVNQNSISGPPGSQPSRFLKLFAGTWKLTYKVRGKSFEEDVVISEFGNYTIVRGGKKTNAFFVENIVFDNNDSHVSFDKIDTGEEKLFPPGHRRQREILDFTVKWNVLEGYAEHDKHYLKYERK